MRTYGYDQDHSFYRCLNFRSFLVIDGAIIRKDPIP